jgi:hypothetical protein
MREIIKTSISINPYYRQKLHRIRAITGESGQDILKKVFYLLLKNLNKTYYVKNGSRSYQPRGSNCRPFTITFMEEEYDFILNIGRLTRMSLSYLFSIGLEVYGDKIAKGASRSERALYKVKRLLTMTIKQNFHNSYGKLGIFRGVFQNKKWKFYYLPYFDGLIPY